MLVLTRKINESIMIGDNVEIVVVDIRHGQVKLGIKAPRSIAVHRSEIYEEIQRENILAAQTSFDQMDELQALIKGGLKKPGSSDKQGK